jgi:hypothetical protein
MNTYTHTHLNACEAAAGSGPTSSSSIIGPLPPTWIFDCMYACICMYVNVCVDIRMCAHIQILELIIGSCHQLGFLTVCMRVYVYMYVCMLDIRMCAHIQILELIIGSCHRLGLLTVCMCVYVCMCMYV